MNEIIRPNEPAPKFCPYLPPIPVMSKVAPGKIEALNFHACLGQGCALYNSCQGEDSPAAARARTVKAIVKALRHAASLPMVGPVLSVIADSLAPETTG